ncbi:MAG: hypothetical protein IKT70_02975 [Clostridia bacterium]|nr:hypothetical protein [Clostridia bacterium]
MKLISVILIFVLTVCCFVGCGNDSGDNHETTVPTDTTVSDTTEFKVEEIPEEKSLYDLDFPYNEYIVLDDYSSTPLKISKKFIVDDDFVNTALLSETVSYGYVDRDDSLTAIEKGHAVSIDFESTINGEEYSGGSQSDFIILIGADMFLPEIENALIGKSSGESFEISATFSDDYYIPTLCGKTADFYVTVNYFGTPSEVTDEMVKELNIEGYQTVEDIKKFYFEFYTEYYESLYAAELNESIWNLLFDSAEIIKLPVCDRVDYCNSMIEYFTAIAKSYGYEYSDFVEAQGYTEDEFYKHLYVNLSKDAIEQKLILSAVCSREEIPLKITQEEYGRYVNDNYSSFGYSSPDEFETVLGRMNIEDSVLFDKVINTLVERLNIIEE